MPEWVSGALGWTLALVSIAGWSAFFSWKMRLDAELSVPFAVCAMVLTLYAGGLLGALRCAAWIVAGLGAGLFALSLWRFREVWKGFLKPGFLLLALFALFIALQVRDDALSHNDDFNHWAVIARNLLLRDALPDAAVTAIDFSTYPPGTALFVYYINRVCLMPFAEGRLILAQDLMEILLLSPLFLCARRAAEKGRGKAAPLYAMLFSCAVLMFLYEFRAMVVDVMNGLVGLCAFVGILCLRDEPKKAAVYAAPVAAVGLLVKFANVYFAGLAFLALLWVNARAKKRGGKPALGMAWLSALFCALIVAAWFLHVRAAFHGVADTHSMNLSRIRDVLSGWSADDIRQIAKVCLHMATDARKSCVLLTLFMNLAALGLAAWNRVFYKRGPARVICAVAVADAAYIGFQLLLFVAYVLSFPREEALRGASYARYNMAIMVWIIGYLSMVIVEEMSEVAQARAWRAVYGWGFAALVALALTVTGEGAVLFRELPYEGTKQAAADAILAENAIGEQDEFFVLAADPDSKQVASVFHYKVNRRVAYGNVADMRSLADVLAAMDGRGYLVVLEDDPAIAALLGVESPAGLYSRAELEAAG